MQNAHKFYINGHWVSPQSGRDFDVINPSNEEVIATISLGGQLDTDSAVDAANSAFPFWRMSSKAERLDLLKNILGIYIKRSEEMASLISQEMGAPIEMAQAQQSEAGSVHIKAFIEVLKSFDFERKLPSNKTNDKIIYEPVGVCGLITPWNWPMNQISLKVIPALAAGCTMILKPSEQAPLSAMLFTEILHEAGVPAGVYNMLNGDGLGVGTHLSSHKKIDMISFTGSTHAGRAITIAGAENIKRVSLELGGKGANLIFSDADPRAVSQGVIHCFNNTGQSCNAPTRMLVERSRYNEAVEQAKSTAEATLVNSASQEGEHIGPLVSKSQFNKVQDLIRVGIEEGARLISGGLGRPEGFQRGYYARPTVFSDCNNDMRIMREEIFGPVLAIMPFDSEEEAIKIANDTEYGLTNYVQTNDQQRAQRVARELRSGMVEINGRGRSTGSPFGGMKQSGNGREGGVWGLEEFLEVRSIGGWTLD
ncbi:aldehyde dehydrogenase family protein [Candidatus Endowatersipora endosymbiont of Watersipora subatra]|uniref:aldehyde dehydrogenase family protein n=1 Tax=Candidatus Endowatersipora endosymbiont of Watersipora subatra TaxID=3077946 RepID=UPI00312C778B